MDIGHRLGVGTMPWWRLALWFVVGFAVVFLVLVAIATAVRAEGDSDTRWVRRGVWSTCEWTGHGCYRHRYRAYDERRRYVRQRYYAPERHREVTLHYRTPDRDFRDDRPRCIDRSLSRVGEERYGKDRAKESAEQQWMEEVRARYGSRYMDTRNAQRVIYECSRSSTGNRASEKAQEVLGKFLEQCIIEAIPCRAEKERAER